MVELMVIPGYLYIYMHQIIIGQTLFFNCLWRLLKNLVCHPACALTKEGKMLMFHGT